MNCTMLLLSLWVNAMYTKLECPTLRRMSSREIDKGVVKSETHGPSRLYNPPPGSVRRTQSSRISRRACAEDATGAPLRRIVRAGVPGQVDSFQQISYYRRA